MAGGVVSRVSISATAGGGRTLVHPAAKGESVQSGTTSDHNPVALSKSVPARCTGYVDPANTVADGRDPVLVLSTSSAHTPPFSTSPSPTEEKEVLPATNFVDDTNTDSISCVHLSKRRALEPLLDALSTTVRLGDTVKVQNRNGMLNCQTCSSGRTRDCGQSRRSITAIPGNIGRESPLSTCVDTADGEHTKEHVRRHAESHVTIQSLLKCYPVLEQTIVFGDQRIQARYASAYPEDVRMAPTVYICHFTLQFFTNKISLDRYSNRYCNRESGRRHPPGREIYRKNGLSFFEIAGNVETEYCRNLCLFSKLFLKTKTVFHNVQNFLFYTLVKWEDDGAHLLGYFSKERMCTGTDYNLSCILTLPQHQRRGYGHLLIDFSYLLSRKEGKTGTPERPLSDLGLLSYRSYWKHVLFDEISGVRQWREEREADLERSSKPPVPVDEDGQTKTTEPALVPPTQLSVRALSAATGMDQMDIISTLQALGMVKYWRGKHFVVTADSSEYKTWLDGTTAALRSKQRKAHASRTRPVLQPSALKWKDPPSTSAVPQESILSPTVAPKVRPKKRKASSR
eukprot:m.677781 g.677781  ORF g.677781 m.677781 type:complete len:570 (-) comp22800_c0_seq1:141-1850(-)